MKVALTIIVFVFISFGTFLFLTVPKEIDHSKQERERDLFIDWQIEKERILYEASKDYRWCLLHQDYGWRNDCPEKFDDSNVKYPSFYEFKEGK